MEGGVVSRVPSEVEGRLEISLDEEPTPSIIVSFHGFIQLDWAHYLISIYYIFVEQLSFVDFS